MAERFESVDKVIARLREADYLADAGIAGVVFLADRLEKPVLVEGPAGVGKTELAKAISATTGLISPSTRAPGPARSRMSRSI
jgi:MoxR-like ATPase